MFFKTKITSLKPELKAAERVTVTLKSLIDLARPASALTLHHSSKRSGYSGGYVSRFKGRGMEFDEARLYQPGDDIRSIDWRVTARTGKTHTKLFREERERPVFISVDNRTTMHFATRGVFKFVQAARLATLLAWAAQTNSDRIGGQVFTDSGCMEIKPQHGRYAVLRFLHSLVNAETGSGTGITLEHTLARLIQHARPGSLVYIISDFRGLNVLAEKHLRRLSEHGDVVLIQIYDFLESELPSDGRYRFTDNDRDVVIDSHDRQRLSDYHQRFAAHCLRLEKLAEKFRMTYIQCSTTDDPLQTLL